MTLYYDKLSEEGSFPINGNFMVSILLDIINPNRSLENDKKFFLMTDLG